MKSRIFFGVLAVFVSCQKNNNNSDIASTRFIHKYGFEVSKNEWKERGKEGQIVQVTKDKVTKTFTYKKGVLDGISTISYEGKEQIKEQQVYEDGILIKKTLYDISGTPISEENFVKDGKTLTFWDARGVPLRYEIYKDNLLQEAKYLDENNKEEACIKKGKGIRLKRSQDRKMILKEEFSDGKMVSRITYHPNGKMQSKAFFKDYKLHGKRETYSLKGNLLTSVTWKDGKRDGQMLCFRDEKKHIEIPYMEGKKDGVEKEYDLEGNIVKEIHWEADKRHGSSRYYYEDYTDIQWYFRGVAVDLKKFQDLEAHEKLMAELNWSKASLESDKY